MASSKYARPKSLCNRGCTRKSCSTSIRGKTPGDGRLSKACTAGKTQGLSEKSSWHGASEVLEAFGQPARRACKAAWPQCETRASRGPAQSICWYQQPGKGNQRLQLLSLRVCCHVMMACFALLVHERELMLACTWRFDISQAVASVLSYVLGG